MTNPSAPVLDRVTPIREGCGCFADAVPMPMGCALCGHAPYAHGCPGGAADHDYVQPSGEVMNARLEGRRYGGPVHLPRFEPPADVAPGEVIPLVPAQRRPEPAVAPEVPRQAPPAAPPARPPLRRRTPRAFPRPGRPPAATRPARRDDNRRPALGTRASTRTHRAMGAAPPSPRRLPSHLIKRTRPALATPVRVLNRTMEIRSVKNANSPAPESAIPGWRVIVSDTGRFWASRQMPFPRETEGYAPPYRTVDGDTLDALRAEVERQEQAARELEAIYGEAAEQTGAGQTADQKTVSGGKKATSGAASGRVDR